MRVFLVDSQPIVRERLMLEAVRKLGLALIVILSGCLPALAQVPSSPQHRQWEASVFGGSSFLGDHQFSTRVSGSPGETSREVGIEYATGYVAGLRIAEHLGKFWAADLEYTFANQPLRFKNLTPAIPTLDLGHSIHHLSYSVSNLPIGPDKRFRPYSRLGVGAVLYYIREFSKEDALAQGVPLRDSWKFTVNLGGGFKYLVADGFALTVDVKDHISGIPSYGLPPSTQVVEGQYEPGFAHDGFQHNWQLSLGASFQFDYD